MSINWFTVLIQILNFAILVFILNKVLYKPIIDMMENRRKSVKDAIDEAETKLSDAEKKKNEYFKKVQEFEDLKAQKLKDIEEEVEEKRRESLASLKKEIDQEQVKMQEFLKLNKDEIVKSVTDLVSNKISDFMKNVFVSISDEDLEEKVLNKFLSKLKTLDPLKIKELNESLNINNGEICFNTAFPISELDKENIANSIKDLGINFTDMAFNVDSDMILGVELAVGSLTISSDIKSIVDDFKINLKTIL